MAKRQLSELSHQGFFGDDCTKPPKRQQGPLTPPSTNRRTQDNGLTFTSPNLSPPSFKLNMNHDSSSSTSVTPYLDRSHDTTAVLSCVGNKENVISPTVKVLLPPAPYPGQPDLPPVALPCLSTRSTLPAQTAVGATPASLTKNQNDDSDENMLLCSRQKAHELNLALAGLNATQSQNTSRMTVLSHALRRVTRREMELGQKRDKRLAQTTQDRETDIGGVQSQIKAIQVKKEQLQCREDALRNSVIEVEQQAQEKIADITAHHKEGCESLKQQNERTWSEIRLHEETIQTAAISIKDKKKKLKAQKDIIAAYE